MIDMTKTIIPKSDQMNADDLIGGPITVKINNVSATTGEQPISIGYEGDNGRPFKPCKSMRRVFVFAWGPDGKAYVGRSMTLYRDPEAMFGGAKVGGIRISHMSHIEGALTMMLTASKSNRKPFTVKPLAAAGSKPAPASSAPPQDLIDAGNSAAMNGVAAYKAWIATLADVQKASLNNHHAGWIDVAKKADTPPDGLDEILPPVPDEG